MAADVRVRYLRGRPFDDSRFKGEANCFRTEHIRETWSGFDFEAEVSFNRRQLSAMINPLTQAGFRLVRILAPLALPWFEEHKPEAYVRLVREPGFV